MLFLVLASSIGATPLATFQQYCFDCHGDGVAMGGLDLQQVLAASDPADSEAWLAIRTRLRSRDMPPTHFDRPTDDVYHQMQQWVEGRIELVETMEQDPAQLTTFERPEGIPGDYREHLDVMSKLMILAFKLDQTRVASFMWANEGSNRSFPFLDVAEGHHQLSHHKGDESMIEKIRRIDRFNVGRFARFVDRLASEPEGDGTLLDNCMVVYGSAIGDGNRHNHDDLPILLAGGGGGTLDPGRHVSFESGTPLCNLYTSLLDRMDVPVDRFGDSTGRLSGL